MSGGEYALGRTGGEYDRLVEQAELMRPLTERMLRASGVGPGMRVLDIGCGVGDVSFLIADFVGEGGSVVGLDVDGAALEVAESRRVASRIPNAEFLKGDVGAVEFDCEFDAAVGRFVLMFVEDPTGVLRNLRQAVRPGGIVAFQEWVGDVHGVDSNRQPLLYSTLELFTKTFQRSGAHLHMGLDLYSRMLEVGFEPDPRPIAEIGLHQGGMLAGARRWALFARSMLPKIVQYELATETSLDPDTLERRLRYEAEIASGFIPLTWLMVAQWARSPMVASPTQPTFAQEPSALKPEAGGRTRSLPTTGRLPGFALNSYIFVREWS